MIRNDDSTAYLIRMLHYQGRVNDAQLQEILSRFHEADCETIIGTLLQEKLVDETWAQDARKNIRMRTRRQKDPEGIVQMERTFGQLALARGWIKVADLEEAMLEQQRMKRLKLFFRIGEILVHFKRLSVDQVKQLLVDQGHTVPGCASCSGLARLLAGADAADPTCPICSGRLVDSIFHDIVEEKSG